MTRADEIRQMSDEELANYLCDMRSPGTCYECDAVNYCYYGHIGMVDYLKEDVKHDL